MNFKSIVLAAPLLAFLSLPIAHAQAPTTTLDAHIDLVHDKPENDPSDPSKALTLKKVVLQKNFAITGTIKKLAQNAEHDLLNMLNPFSFTRFFKKADLSYEEIKNEKPSLFNLFNINHHRNVPQVKYGPTNVNANHEYKGISDRKFGYCWGYATYVRFFTQVAFYDATKARPPLKVTYAAIDEILKGKATVIDGYANLRELTLVPEIEFYLKLAAMELWRARAVKFASIGITMKSTNWMDFNEVEEFTKNLEARIARGELPKIIFASLIPSEPYLGMNTDIHVVPAYKVERLSEKRIRIHLWDINFYTETLMREPKFLDIDSNHGVHYAPYVEPEKPYATGSDLIGRMLIAPENDAETATMLNSLARFCKNKKTAEYCKHSD